MTAGRRPMPTRGIVEGALLAAILVALVVATFYLPVSGLLFACFWPVPIALLYLRYDSRVALLAVVASAIILSLTVGPADALDVAFLYGPVGVALGHAAKHRWSAGCTFAIGAAAVAVAALGTISTFWLLAGQAPGTWLAPDIGNFVDSLAAMEQSRLLQTGSAEFVSGLLAQVPWMALVFTGALGLAIDYLALRAVLTRLGYQMPALPRFGEWRSPAWVRGVAALLALGWYARASLPAGRLVAALTVLMPFAMGYLALQGLAILDHALAVRGAGLLVRVVFYALLVTFGTAWPLLAAGAVIDPMIDLRRRLAGPVQPAATGEKEDANESHPDAGHQDSRKKGKRRRSR